MGQPISTQPAGWTTRSHETGHWRQEPAACDAAAAGGVVGLLAAGVLAVRHADRLAGTLETLRQRVERLAGGDTRPSPLTTGIEEVDRLDEALVRGAQHTARRLASERDFAGVLDFYGVRWEYEPRTFVLLEDEAGNPTEAFSPDFYLTDLDLYIELTTLRQRLVTKKNGKVRRLKERHPEVNIMILYRRDWVNLAVKYGIGTAA